MINKNKANTNICFINQVIGDPLKLQEMFSFIEKDKLSDQSRAPEKSPLGITKIIFFH